MKWHCEEPLQEYDPILKNPTWLMQQKFATNLHSIS